MKGSNDYIKSDGKEIFVNLKTFPIDSNNRSNNEEMHFESDFSRKYLFNFIAKDLCTKCELFLSRT